MSEQDEKPENEQEQWPKLSASAGLAAWLRDNQVALACSSYQTGQLFLVGANPDGGVNVDQQNFIRAMGLWYEPGKLWLGSRYQIWRLENVLDDGSLRHGKFDRLFIPRVAHTTGSVDIHELGMTTSGLVWVNTRYSCLSRLDERHSFSPAWKPSFISRFANEDRCHLNGMCINEGEVRYVSAAGTSDEPGGWRENKADGGVLIDVATGEVAARGFCMPHSPRLHNGRLYALDSGHGNIVEIDLRTGRGQAVAFGQGFLRGLSFVGDFAVVGSSKPRDKVFAGLPLEQALSKRALDPWSAIMIFDLRTGEMAEWLRFETRIEETFDVAVMPGVRCPMSVGSASKEIEGEITF